MPTSPHYDVVVTGARPAGAATALLLARHGAQVLLLDRSRYGTDTLDGTAVCYTVPLTTVPLTTVPLTTVPLTTVPLTTVPLTTGALALADEVARR
jgi:glycine/D-amino acid oxidase-like deaminating enzyme